jgi:hypothetical protein
MPGTAEVFGQILSDLVNYTLISKILSTTFSLQAGCSHSHHSVVDNVWLRVGVSIHPNP